MVALAWIGCCAVFVTIGAVMAAGRTRGNAVDQVVDAWVLARFTADREALHAIADFGLLALYVVTAALVVAALVARRARAAVLVIVAVLVSSGLTEWVLKPLVHESLGRFVTYPSGTTTNAFALVAVIGLLARSLPRPLGVLLLAVAGIVAGAIAVAMIGLRYHYFTDTVAGAAVGTAVALGVAIVLDVAAVRVRQAH